MAVDGSHASRNADWRMARNEIWWRARLLPLQVGAGNLEHALRYTDVQPKPGFEGLAVEQIADWVIAATRRPWLMRKRRCLRQGLLGMRFMRHAGYTPELHFGIDAKSIVGPVLSAHCWVVLDGRPVLNTILDDMVVIHVHQPWA